VNKVSKLLLILLALLAFGLLCYLCVVMHYDQILALNGGGANVAVANANNNSNVAVSLASASFKAETKDGKFVVSGVVPDQATKDQLLAKAREVHGADNVIDQVTIDAKTAKPSWLSGVLALLPFTTKDVKNGGIAVEGKSLSLLGQVPSADIKTKIGLDVSKAVGADVTVNNLLTVGAATVSADQAKAQVAINEQLTGKIVEFETNSDQLTAKGKAVLDELVPIFQGAPTTNFEVGGHTDSDGDDAKNLKLSARRAVTVKNYLVGKGLAADRFTPKGFGEAQPKADNTTAEGKQRNRRIEFTVKGENK
jgi:OmpA-OmpF porin, OOP family